MDRGRRGAGQGRALNELRYRWLDAIVGKEGRVGPLGSSVRHAAITLAAFMDDDGTCWPSLTTLAGAMQRHRTTVIRALNELEAQGWVSRNRGTFDRPTVYRAVIPVVAPRDGGSSASATGVVAPRDGGSSASATRTPQEHAIEHSMKSKKGDSILRNQPFNVRVSETFMRSRNPEKWNPEDFGALRDVALELKSQYPEEVILEGVRSFGRSDDPPPALPIYVEAVAA